MRDGFGRRHPILARLLGSRTAAVTVEEVWADGRLPLRISGYTEPARLPDEVVTSVRCIVHVADGIVVCENADGYFHIWPGGRRAEGETFAETAAREVYEETGWLLDERSVREIGWLHFEHLSEQPDDHPYPHPDFLQVVVTAVAGTREGDPDTWSDVEGYEIASRSSTLEEARSLVSTDPLCVAFLDLSAEVP